MTAARRRLAACAAAIAAIAGLLALRAALAETPLDRLAREPGVDRWSGSIHLPRGGRYQLGCQCAQPVTVTVGEHRLVLREGPGGAPQVASVDLRAGVAALTVTGRPRRLLWHPPGRRGDLEYLPASSVSPDPPDRARFGAWAGAAPLDGLVAIGVLAVLAALATFLGWARLRAAWVAHRRTILAAAAIGAVALAARLFDLGGAGQTWDEDVNWSAGRNYVTNLVALDASPRSWIWNYEHPPVMKYLAGIGAQLADGYGPARAISALCLALGCALLVPIGARLWSLRAGVVAGLAAALTPHLVAHGKVVGHEAPTVLWWTLGVWLALRAFDGLDAAPPAGDLAARRAQTRALAARLAGVGVVLGIAIASRFVNGLLAPMLGITLLASAPRHLRARTVALGLAILPVVAAAVLVAIWPRLWTAPIDHLGAAWAKLSKPHGPEPFLGAITATPPRWYFVAYLGATAPLGLLLAAGAGLARAALRARREARATIVALALLVVPLAVALSPVRQDGVRYILPSLVALALLAGAGVDLVAARIGERGGAAGRRRAAGPLLAGALAAYLAIVCVRIHPYYLDYYGEHVGGPAGVARRRAFELGWWGEGVAEATRHVARRAAPGDRVFRDCVETVHLAWWHEDAWAHLARRPDEADWIVVQPAWRPCPVPAGARLDHVVRAMGAPLVLVYRVDRDAAPAPTSSGR